MEARDVVYFPYEDNVLDYLSQKDPVLGRVINDVGRIERPINPDIFPALISSIISQLISTKAAETVKKRMITKFKNIDAETLANVSADDIQTCGITMRKATYIKNVADMVNNGEFDIDELKVLPDKEVIERLSSLNGIGKWTAEMLLIHSLARKDVISYGDLAIRRGMCKLYNLDDISKKEFDKYVENYSPYSSIASIYIWHISAND